MAEIDAFNPNKNIMGRTIRIAFSSNYGTDLG